MVKGDNIVLIIERMYGLQKGIGRLKCHALDMLSWHVLRFLTNKIVPFYYSRSERRAGTPVSDHVDKEVIVSLTSFPARMSGLPIVLESLFRQTVKPDRIILWLAEEQFSEQEKVLEDFKEYVKSGLEIRFCEDLRAHKKYFYTMKENPEAIVITVDDDIFYSERMIERLIQTYKENPSCIVAERAHQMKKKDGKLLPYNQWNWRAVDCMGPDLYLCATGGAGCLYPPHCLSEHIFDKETLKKYCFLADDIWLKCMEYLVGTEVVLTEKNHPEVYDVLGAKDNGLAKVNVEQGSNDSQLRDVAAYYGIRW